MTVKELIEELERFDGDMEVYCSVDCDTDDTPADDARRVFGYDCMGVNPYVNQVVLLFLLESCNFKGECDPSRKKGP